MGRIRLPLALQTGNLTVLQQQERRADEEAIKTGTDQILEPPKWMDDDLAIEEWKRVVPQLLEINVVGNLDLANIAGYCVAYSHWRKASDVLEREEYVVPTAESQKTNPLVDVQIKYATEMRRFGDQCGMSINSRLKAAAEKRKAADTDIEATFGAI